VKPSEPTARQAGSAGPRSEPAVGFAVVGCGAVAASHYLPALAGCRRAEAVLVVDRDAGRAHAAAARWGVPAVATDAGEVPGRAEAAVVALPNHLHAPVAIDLLRAGVHVLVEKPMGLSTAECDAMIEAAAQGGARLTVGLQFRFFNATELVRDLLAGGLLGPLQGFEMRLGVVSRWPFATDFVLRREAAGGGVLVDYGVHVLDLLLHWLGDWKEVRYRDDAYGGVESDCELDLAFASGVAGTIEISRTRNLRNTCLFIGERGRLEVGIWDPDPPIVLETAGSAVALSGRASRDGGAGLDFLGAFGRQLDDLAGAVREGREPFISGAEGRRSVFLIEACYAVREPLELPWVRPSLPVAG
jgi:predicted dehydrogenase